MISFLIEHQPLKQVQYAFLYIHHLKIVEILLSEC